MRDRSATAARVVGQLRQLGGQQLADVFMFPVLDSGRRQWCRYGEVSRVRWRDQEQDFFLRGGRLPFDIVPLRPTDPARAGCWYSLGPGLADDEQLVDDLLLIQLEGPGAEVTKRGAAVRAAVSAGMRVLEQHTTVAGREGWHRHCLSAIPEAE